jgi:hypothetical protein
MARFRIVVRPVYDSALFIPIELSIKLEGIPFSKPLDPRRQVDIVSDE